MSIKKANKRILYLSGAPRVSTREDAENIAARSHVLGIIQGFSQNKLEVDTFIIGNKLPSFFSSSGSEGVTRKNKLSRFIADIFRLLVRIFGRLWAYKSKKDYDFLFTYERFALMQSMGFIFKIKKKIPWILETNAILYKESIKESNTLFFKKLAFNLEKKAYEKCDGLVCVTDSLKELVIKEFDIDPQKILVVRNGVDSDFFKPAVDNSIEIESKLNTLNIGYIGSLTVWSKLNILFKAIQELKGQSIFKVILHIIGEGPKKNDLIKLTHDYDLEGNIIFYGRVEQAELSGYVKKIDLAYCNSVHGKLGQNTYGSPMKLYEYMAFAKPVLAGAFEDTKIMIEEGVTGFLFKWDDLNDLKKAILKAYEKKDLLVDMGLAARNKVDKNHSWKSRTQAMLDKLDLIIDQNA